jgi:hypothetical protein
MLRLIYKFDNYIMVTLGTSVARKWKRICTIFRNVAKTVAQNIKIQIERSKQLHPAIFNAEISTTNHILKKLI